MSITNWMHLMLWTAHEPSYVSTVINYIYTVARNLWMPSSTVSPLYKYNVHKVHRSMKAKVNCKRLRYAFRWNGHWLAVEACCTYVTQSNRFSRDAICSGESPCTLTVLRSHLALRRTSAISTQPENAAQCKQIFSSFQDKATPWHNQLTRQYIISQKAEMNINLMEWSFSCATSKKNKKKIRW